MYKVKRQNNEVKGIFRKDKQSNLINLNPLHNKIKNEIEINEKFNNKNFDKIRSIKKDYFSDLNLQLKVNKNFDSENYFENIKTEILDIFLDSNDYIPYEYLNNSIGDVFEFNSKFTKKQKCNFDNFYSNEEFMENISDEKIIDRSRTKKYPSEKNKLFEEKENSYEYKNKNLF